MKLLKLVPDDTNIGFLKWRNVAFAISSLLMIASLFFVVTKGLNFGVDFIGGQMIRVTFTESKEAPVQELRIGDIVIGTSPCETFAETGLEFKQRSPFKNSFMVELAHGYYGYLPTPRHFELGGYETWPGTNYLEPTASDKILAALLEMTSELKR